MNKVLKIEYILSIIGLTMITIGLFMIIIDKLNMVIVDKINQERCYNLPLNDFYKDKSCLKYKERLIR